MASGVIQTEIKWPEKYELLGVQISATTYDEAVDVIIDAAGSGVAATVSAHAVHAVVTASGDRALRDAVNSFQLVAPDGQPVRWALNRLYGTSLSERVYGPELMLRLCARAARERISVFLYGGATEHVVASLEQRLCRRIPNLEVAGHFSPPFRELTEEEDDRLIEMIEESGAGLVFIGLGCPKQDWFAYHHRDRLRAVQVCVGAAFDFHAGRKKMAPRWMQQFGLEWVYRLGQEPRRLWRRYLVTNTAFVAGVSAQWWRQGKSWIFREAKKK